MTGVQTCALPILGDYHNPKYGIEFKCTKSWNFQSIVFDYMKLMDSNNLLQKSMSFLIIYRENKFSNRLNIDKINETINELINRLNERLEIKRPFLFWIIEISVKTKGITSWYCNNLNEKFLSGIPKHTSLWCDL